MFRAALWPQLATGSPSEFLSWIPVLLINPTLLNVCAYCLNLTIRESSHSKVNVFEASQPQNQTLTRRWCSNIKASPPWKFGFYTAALACWLSDPCQQAWELLISEWCDCFSVPPHQMTHQMIPQWNNTCFQASVRNSKHLISHERVRNSNECHPQRLFLAKSKHCRGPVREI